MSQELERVYTINLGKVLLSPDNIRAKRAINMIREFARHHMKVEDIKIEESLAHHIWSRGIKHPPRKVRVRMTKTDEGFVLVEPFEEEIESVKPEEKKSVVEETKKIESKEETMDSKVTEETKEETLDSEIKKVPKKVADTTSKKTTTKEPEKTKPETKQDSKAAPKKDAKSASKKKVKKASK